MPTEEMPLDEVVLHLSDLRLIAADRGTDLKAPAESRIECKRIVTALTIAIDAVSKRPAQ